MKMGCKDGKCAIIYKIYWTFLLQQKGKIFIIVGEEEIIYEFSYKGRRKWVFI